MRPPTRPFRANVAFKINAKTGGSNAHLAALSTRPLPMLYANQRERTMVFGADVTHPMGGESMPSIAAVVGSMDWPGMGQYRALVSSQSAKLEIIKNLYTYSVGPDGQEQHGGMVRELMLASQAYNRGGLPQRIIFYRDGVSEGQFQEVKQKEVMAIKRACASFHPDYQPRLTFVVVQKRHHTRFFVPDRAFLDRSGNAKPGTVVDTTICHPTEFDFYLMSHAGIQGTSRPTHYHVVHDENNFTSDMLQQFTYNLSYTYARCTRSVSVAPPAYYAHLVAFRARFYVDSEASETGSQVSQTGGSSRSPSDVVVRPLPELRRSIMNKMFFC